MLNNTSNRSTESVALSNSIFKGLENTYGDSQSYITDAKKIATSIIETENNNEARLDIDLIEKEKLFHKAISIGDIDKMLKCIDLDTSEHKDIFTFPGEYASTVGSDRKESPLEVLNITFKNDTLQNRYVQNNIKQKYVQWGKFLQIVSRHNRDKEINEGILNSLNKTIKQAQEEAKRIQSPKNESVEISNEKLEDIISNQIIKILSQSNNDITSPNREPNQEINSIKATIDNKNLNREAIYEQVREQLTFNEFDSILSDLLELNGGLETSPKAKLNSKNSPRKPSKNFIKILKEQRVYNNDTDKHLLNEDDKNTNNRENIDMTFSNSNSGEKKITIPFKHKSKANSASPILTPERADTIPLLDKEAENKTGDKGQVSEIETPKNTTGHTRKNHSNEARRSLDLELNASLLSDSEDEDNLLWSGTEVEFENNDINQSDDEIDDIHIINEDGNAQTNDSDDELKIDEDSLEGDIKEENRAAGGVDYETFSFDNTVSEDGSKSDSETDSEDDENLFANLEPLFSSKIVSGNKIFTTLNLSKEAGIEENTTADEVLYESDLDNESINMNDSLGSLSPISNDEKNTQENADSSEKPSNSNTENNDLNNNLKLIGDDTAPSDTLDSSDNSSRSNINTESENEDILSQDGVDSETNSENGLNTGETFSDGDLSNISDSDLELNSDNVIPNNTLNFNDISNESDINLDVKKLDTTSSKPFEIIVDMHKIEKNAEIKKTEENEVEEANKIQETTLYNICHNFNDLVDGKNPKLYKIKDYSSDTSENEIKDTNENKIEFAYLSKPKENVQNVSFVSDEVREEIENDIEKHDSIGTTEVPGIKFEKEGDVITVDSNLSEGSIIRVNVNNGRTLGFVNDPNGKGFIILNNIKKIQENGLGFGEAQKIEDEDLEALSKLTLNLNFNNAEKKLQISGNELVAEFKKLRESKKRYSTTTIGQKKEKKIENLFAKPSFVPRGVSDNTLDNNEDSSDSAKEFTSFTEKLLEEKAEVEVKEGELEIFC